MLRALVMPPLHIHTSSNNGGAPPVAPATVASVTAAAAVDRARAPALRDLRLAGCTRMSAAATLADKSAPAACVCLGVKLTTACRARAPPPGCRGCPLAPPGRRHS